MLSKATNQPKSTVDLGYMCPRGLTGPPEWHSPRSWNIERETSWVAIATPTDRPKSVRNRSVIELFVALFVL